VTVAATRGVSNAARACLMLGIALGGCGRRVDQPSPVPATGSHGSGVDVQSYRFELTLPDGGQTLRGRASISIIRDAGVDSLQLDLLIPVDSVVVRGAAVRFTQYDGRLTIPLDAVPDTATITVVYHGAPDDGLIVSHDQRGHWQAFGDNWPNRARHWLPTVDHPSDKALVEWTISAPDRLTVVANGTLFEKTTANGRSTWIWRESRPLPTYLMVIAAAELVAHPVADARCVFVETGGCLQQTVYTSADPGVQMPRAFSKAADIAGFYASIVAPFPYEKLAHVQSTTIFGGMENATAIFYSDQSFRTGTMNTRLIAHETAHQWFGDAVTEREWAHLWLSEGFATYFAELYAEHALGHDTLVAHMRAMRQGLLADLDVVPTRPVIDTAQTDYTRLLNANSYDKGAFVLHMARALLGDSAFFRGVRSYYASHRHGNSVSDDLRAAFEGVSGRDLRWFFDQWLRRPGYPEVATSWSYDRAAQRVYLVLKQRPRFGNFRFPLVVEMERADGVVVRATVEIPAAPSTHLEIPLALDASPRRVTLDPDAQLLANLDPPREQR
jgi:aminopeptidase N